MSVNATGPVEPVRFTWTAARERPQGLGIEDGAQGKGPVMYILGPDRGPAVPVGDVPDGATFEKAVRSLRGIEGPQGMWRGGYTVAFGPKGSATMFHAYPPSVAPDAAHEAAKIGQKILATLSKVR